MSPSMTSETIFLKICSSGKILERCKGRITERRNYEKIELQKEGIMKRQNYGVTER